jgi:hypothetical protein
MWSSHFYQLSGANQEEYPEIDSIKRSGRRGPPNYATHRVSAFRADSAETQALSLQKKFPSILGNILTMGGEMT